MTIPFFGQTPVESKELVAELPALGYTDAWSAEVGGTDGFVPLALAAEWAPSLRLGTAIVPVYTRGPALLAMSAATLADLAPGRFVLGIGASSPVIVGNWNSRRVRQAVRAGPRHPALPAGGAGRGEGRRKLRDLRRQGIPAGEGPRDAAEDRAGRAAAGMLRLAAREADGAITNWLSPQDVRKVRAELGRRPS